MYNNTVNIKWKEKCVPSIWKKTNIVVSIIINLNGYLINCLLVRRHTLNPSQSKIIKCFQNQYIVYWKQ